MHLIAKTCSRNSGSKFIRMRTYTKQDVAFVAAFFIFFAFSPKGSWRCLLSRTSTIREVGRVSE